jgi:3-deoxy-D-manno-octulosonate 8-phosphate phosphatase (KDO 8-P phosphatase)
MGGKYPADIMERAGRVKLLVLDVDGVLTDGRLIYSTFGDETKNFSVSDGLGIFMVKKAGIACAIVTAKASPAVESRAEALGIDALYQDFHYKIDALIAIRERFGVEDSEICFVGDDLIDIPILRRVGLAVSPPNAMEDVKPFAHLITEKRGGHGSVREVCDLILKAKGKWDEVTARYYND